MDGHFVTINDKLTIKDVEKRTHLECPDYSQLAQQLLDTMCENERLRALLQPCAHTIMDNIFTSETEDGYICKDCLSIQYRNKDSIND